MIVEREREWEKWEKEWENEEREKRMMKKRWWKWMIKWWMMNDEWWMNENDENERKKKFDSLCYWLNYWGSARCSFMKISVDLSHLREWESESEWERERERDRSLKIIIMIEEVIEITFWLGRVSIGLTSLYKTESYFISLMISHNEK